MSHPRRAFVDLQTEDPINQRFFLDSGDSEHFRKVLRLRVDDFVTVVDPNKERAFNARISDFAKHVEVEILSPKPEKSFRSPVSILACALLKNDHNDLIVEKATELGVRQICFFAGDRSVLRLKDDLKASKKLERWNKIAQSSARQSIKLFYPTVALYGSLKTFLTATQGLPILYGSLEEQARPLAELLSNPQFPTSMIIGPEGDFSDEEIALLSKNGALGLSLGNFVLRAETAAICAVSTLNTLAQLSS
ncbi:MAG: 16S rRNA (uracil(1498)-N(3))-methyltransferase [Bdellovibrionales bacterium]|nr:16S rRNA (uracil(1498)-N(3))-methyltransferase [Bdellovibrionales bacterium]